MKIGKIWTFRFWFLFFCRKQEGINLFQRIMIKSSQAGTHFKIILVQIYSVQPHEKITTFGTGDLFLTMPSSYTKYDTNPKFAYPYLWVTKYAY